jgi:hypothetical protein
MSPDFIPALMPARSAISCCVISARACISATCLRSQPSI